MDIREENTTGPKGRAPLRAQFSRAFRAVSNSLVFPHPSLVSFSCPAPCARQTKRRFSYGFRLGSISEPQDCRAELSGARLKSRLPTPPAAHISETDKILPLGTLRKRKRSDNTCPSKEPDCECQILPNAREVPTCAQKWSALIGENP